MFLILCRYSKLNKEADKKKLTKNIFMNELFASVNSVALENGAFKLDQDPLFDSLLTAK